MNATISVFVIGAEAIIYFPLYNLHDCTFNHAMIYQICDVSWESGAFLNISFESQLIKSPNLASW